MSAGTRPPLLLLGGREAFVEYEKAFRTRYQNEFVNDVQGNRILFREHMCRHACLKSTEENRYKQGQREVWVQERAEHIPWIIAFLTDPGTELFPNDQDPHNRVNAASSTAQQSHGWDSSIQGRGFRACEGDGYSGRRCALRLSCPDRLWS